ncbi:hypothetical protein K4039_28795 [Lyngbya sp. CCAP 1446/10]|nr:hypothetical protein [Lyngbya sp. CCAP 1446/10]MCW6053943.1 hypothetical protein [Lyngbya sp. CCAP 1446/10]
MTEGRRKKEEGRRKKEEGRRKTLIFSNLQSTYNLQSKMVSVCAEN